MRRASWLLIVPFLLVLGCVRPEVEAFRMRPAPVQVTVSLPAQLADREGLQKEYAAALRARLSTRLVVVAEGVKPPPGAVELRVVIQDISPSAHPSPAAVGVATGVTVGALSAVSGNRGWGVMDGLFWGLFVGGSVAAHQEREQHRLGYRPEAVRADARLLQPGNPEPLWVEAIEPREVVEAMDPLPWGYRDDDGRIEEEEARGFARVVVQKLSAYFHLTRYTEQRYYGVPPAGRGEAFPPRPTEPPTPPPTEPPPPPPATLPPPPPTHPQPPSDPQPPSPTNPNPPPPPSPQPPSPINPPPPPPPPPAPPDEPSAQPAPAAAQTLMEARVIHCSGCGASVPPEATQCPYCQAQLATVACPVCFALAPLSASHCPGCGAALAPRPAAEPEGSPCPACRKPLAATRVGDLEVRECPACGGLWLDRAAFEQLGASRERQGAVLGALPAPGAPPVASLEAVQYRPCPACGQRMNRVNYARRSGVVLDVCKEHGIWFDRDELRRVLAFISEGGLDRSRELELEELKEAQRAAQAPGRPAPSGEFTPPMNPGPHWLGVSGLAWLASEVAGHFWNRD